jgi:excisionase family DNA binding protein
MSAPVNSPWLTTREAADYARRGPRQIRQAIKSGKLRAAIVGGKRQGITRREWLDEMIEAEAAVLAFPMRRRA